MRILIADDDRMSTLMLGRTLEKWDFEVSVAHDGLEAWACISGSEPPALVIVDWMMPGLDGIQLCRRIRETPRLSPLYLIVLSTRSHRDDIVAGLEAGADDYLAKPFDPHELLARIHVGQRTLQLIANVKRLTGLLPICSYCKSIRSDENYWQQVETYLGEHSDVRFSHGVCPSCLARVLVDDGLAAPVPPTDET